jgi:hypothetical protein
MQNQEYSRKFFVFAARKTQNITEFPYRVNLVDEHAEVRHIRVVSTEVRVARLHATVVGFLDFLRGCIWHLVVQESGVKELYI